MSVELAGALATALAVFCLLLIPQGASPLLTTAFVHPEQTLLREAGWTRSMPAWECLRFGAALCTLALAGAVGSLPLGLVGAILPSIGARVLAAQARERRARETVAVLQMTVAGLRSGSSLTEALRLATKAETLGVFADAVRAFDLGAPLDVALGSARARAQDPRVVVGLDALILCVAERLSAERSAMLVSSAAERLVFEQRLVDELRARTAGHRVQIVLLAALVPGLALYLCLTLPGMCETLATPLGRFVLLPLAALLEGAGVLLSRRVVRDLV